MKINSPHSQIIRSCKFFFKNFSTKFYHNNYVHNAALISILLTTNHLLTNYFIRLSARIEIWSMEQQRKISTRTSFASMLFNELPTSMPLRILSYVMLPHTFCTSLLSSLRGKEGFPL